MSLINNDFYSVAELAKPKSVHPKSIYRWIKQGVAPKHELFAGMYWFYKKEADSYKVSSRGPRGGRK